MICLDLLICLLFLPVSTGVNLHRMQPGLFEASMGPTENFQLPLLRLIILLPTKTRNLKPPLASLHWQGRRENCHLHEQLMTRSLSKILYTLYTHIPMLYANCVLVYILNYIPCRYCSKKCRSTNNDSITAVTARVLITLRLVTFVGSYLANPDGKFHVYSSQARSIYLVFSNVCISANPSYKRLKWGRHRSHGL